MKSTGDLEQAVWDIARLNEISAESWTSMMEILGALKAHNIEAYDHSLRVGVYSAGLARKMYWDDSTYIRIVDEVDARIRLALFGGCAHDVGKCTISNDVLRAEHFGPEERRIIEGHSEAGYILLQNTHLMSALVAGMHHTHQDGGYGINLDREAKKHGLTSAGKTNVQKASKLVALCDFFDALTTRNNDRKLVSSTKNEEEIMSVLLQYFPSSSEEIDWLMDHLI